MELLISNLKNKGEKIFNKLTQEKKRYRDIVSYEKRCSDYMRIKAKYINMIPIIVESDDLILDKNKFLVHMYSSMSNLVYSIRKQLKLPPEKGIFIFCDNKLLNLNLTINEVYESYIEKNRSKIGNDFFLYFEVKEESVFG